MQHSISNWIYATEDLEKSFQRLAKYKYDAVELEGEPDKEKYEPKKVKKCYSGMVLKFLLLLECILGKKRLKGIWLHQTRRLRNRPLYICSSV
jgi:hypothetical protein